MPQLHTGDRNARIEKVTPRRASSENTSLTSEVPGTRPESMASVLDSSWAQRSSRTVAVQVVVRFRPRVREDELQDLTAFSTHPNGRSVESADGTYCFDFSRAFGEAAKQEDVFEHVGKPVVSDVLNGYNGTILAYGQTFSGKTYSMFGPENLATDAVLPELQGMVPRAARQVFDHIEGSSDYDTEFTLRCSFMEVYKEKMKDLLRPNVETLRVKELPQRGLFVDGLSREYVTCPADVMSVIRAGLRTRVVGKTRCNLHSSRSHAIFVLHAEQRSLQGEERLGKLTLVDLAGSEKVSKSESVGETLEEAKKINWSLSALGKVIDALVEQRSHVPYRDSQLTRVLQEALGGNCRTTLLVAASGCAQHADETLSSLRFATRAKNVRNVAKVNYTFSQEQLLLVVAKLQKQLMSANQHIIELGGLPQESPDAELNSTLRKGARAMRRSSTASASKFGSVSEEASHALASSSSLRLGDCSESAEAHNDEDDDDIEAVSLPLYDEAFRPLALAARNAIWSLEATLLAQEKGLAEARLLRAHREDTGEKSSHCPGTDGRDLISERFRALQYAVDARSYQWRLHLEKHRSESLAMEMKMRAKFSQANTYAVDRSYVLTMVQSTCVEHMLPVAGTGDTGGEQSGISAEQSQGFEPAASKEGEGLDAAQLKAQMEVLQQNYDAMKAEFTSQKVLLARRSAKLREKAKELHSRDLQLSSLRHEIQIKDALLKCLKDEERKQFRTADHELEVLLEQAMSPLSAILTSEQMALARPRASEVPSSMA
ncbi:unnamed protein product [Effrenium voratum]|nr:unnamed protein product [Effrenium voratum]